MASRLQHRERVHRHRRRRATAREFASEVCAFCNEPRKAILRFTGGCWAHDHELYEAVAAASFDDLILAGDLKERIIEDFTSFLGARAEYERYGVPHKRGVLLLGPPGNGKTHCLRALIKLLAIPCIYVTSLKAKYATEDSSIDTVFSRAHEITPCVLVFEDIDAMIHDKNRSFFLNKLDALSHAPGLVTLATTNHPERLDPAIIHRPSRFDRKYHFELPAASERAAYLAMWNERVDPAMRVEGAIIAELVEDTHEFSFAYLKELWLSAMVRWMHDRIAGEMRAHLRVQLRALREQMTSPVPVAPPATTPELDDDD
jgi:AAA+ superfamily predicted ATPase